MRPSDLDPLLSQLSDRLAKRIGLHFPPERRPDLLRGLHAMQRELQATDLRSCIRQLLASPLERAQVEVLARHLTVGETYFFRDPQMFDALRTLVLAPLIEARRTGSRHLRVWSAGCASGEEAYSLAMLIRQLLPDYREWTITILATDINPAALEKAERGVYGAWSFRNMPTAMRECYFRRTERGYEIDASLRDMVRFSYLNLAELAFPALGIGTQACDLILCRNVLMYFAPELAAAVMRKLSEALVDEGWLGIGPSEIPQARPPEFASVHIAGAILLRKASDTGMPSNAMAPSPAAASCAMRRRHAPAPIAARAPLEKPCLQEYGGGQRQPGDASFLRLQARTHANRGALTQALQWAEQATAADRLHPLGYYLRAVVLQEMGQIEEAVRHYRHTLYLDPDFVLAHFALGNLLRQQRKWSAADRHFKVALQLLDRYGREDELPESDGLTAGHLKDLISGSIERREA